MTQLTSWALAFVCAAALAGCSLLNTAGDYTFAQPDAGSVDASQMDGAARDAGPDLDATTDAGPDLDAGPDAGSEAGPPNGRVVYIAAGGNDTCALYDDGTLSCWGDNVDGQLGVNDTLAHATVVTVMWPGVRVATPADGVPQPLALGDGHACAVDTSGYVYCWGDDERGEIGAGSGFSMRPLPTLSARAYQGFTHVACGGALDSDGSPAPDGYTCGVVTGASADTVYCWGDDAYGMLGDGSDGPPGPEAVMGLPTLPAHEAAEIEAGDGHVCLRLASGDLWCWGLDDEGQLGLGTTTDQLTAQQVTAFPSARAIATGGHHTCGWGDAALQCWGFDDRGQLGVTATTTPQTMPVLVGGSLPAATMPQTGDVAAGYKTSYAIDGMVAYAFGANDQRQLGSTLPPVSGTADVDTPVQIELPAGRVPVQIAAGDRHACALLDDGSVACWGKNDRGQAVPTDTTDATILTPTIVLPAPGA